MTACLPHSWQHWTMWAVVIVCGVLGAALRPSAGVLALQWAYGDDYACRTGDGLPIGLYWKTDLIAAAVICLAVWPLWKPHARPEVGVLLIFPLAALVYVSPIHPYWQWHALWVLVILQFLLVAPWPLFNRIRTMEFRRGSTGRPIWTKGG